MLKNEVDVGASTLIAGNVACYLIALSRFDEARTHARDALELSHGVELLLFVCYCVQRLAAVAALRSHATEQETDADVRRAARLLGFAEKHNAVTVVFDSDRAEVSRIRAALEAALHPGEVARLCELGASLTQEEAVRDALEV